MSDKETPPLTRGRLERRTPDELHWRNTPAYAGKTGSDAQVEGG